MKTLKKLVQCDGSNASLCKTGKCDSRKLKSRLNNDF
jgi:hypothetical protein